MDKISGWVVNNIGTLLMIAGGLIFLAIGIRKVLGFIRQGNEVGRMEYMVTHNEYKAAVRMGEKLLKTFTGDSLVIMNLLAQAYEGLGDTPNAVRYLEKVVLNFAVNSQPDWRYSVYVHIADLYRRNGRSKEALGYYTLILKERKSYTRALFSAAELLYDMKNYIKAREYMEVFLRIKPHSQEGHMLYANVEYELTNYYKSKAHYLRAIELMKIDNPSRNKAVLMLAKSCFNLKEYQYVVDYVSPLLMEPEFKEEAVTLSIYSYLKMDKRESAYRLFHEVAFDLPIDRKTELLYAVGESYLQRSQVYFALKVWEEVQKMNPKCGRVKCEINKYELLLSNPALANIFEGERERKIRYITRVLHLPTETLVIEKPNFCLFFSNGSCNVVYTYPGPFMELDLNLLEDTLKEKAISPKSIQLYSLFGTSEPCKHTLFYRRLNVVHGDDFLNTIIPARKAPVETPAGGEVSQGQDVEQVELQKQEQ